MNIVGFLVDVLKGALKDISGFFITFIVLLPPAKDRWRSSLPLVHHGPLLFATGTWEWRSPSILSLRYIS